jgi:lysophospholipase L1-like esterase
MKPSLTTLAASAALAAAFHLPAAQSQTWTSEHWTATWGAGGGAPAAGVARQEFSGQTLRMVVHASKGGNRVRIRLSNEFGNTPLTVGAAHIAVAARDAETVPGSDRVLTFGGNPAFTIAPGAPALSDPVELNVAPLADIAVSIYLPGTAATRMADEAAGQASYVSMPGDFTAAPTLPAQRKIASMPFLAEVDVDGAGAAIVALGDSISAGAGSTTAANRRWTDFLARRLQAAHAPGLEGNRLGVVNRHVPGERLLAGAAGRSQGALARFDTDVLATAGVRYAIVLAGGNDIAASEAVKPADLIAGYQQLIERAHQNRIRIIGATLLPFEGARGWSAAKEDVRQAVNTWIRASAGFDGVVDFDAAVRDPMHHARLLPAFDSGDHVHPNDLGYEAMAGAVPLTLFQQQAADVHRAPPTAK